MTGDADLAQAEADRDHRGERNAIRDAVTERERNEARAGRDKAAQALIRATVTAAALRTAATEMLAHIDSGGDYTDPVKLARWREALGEGGTHVPDDGAQGATARRNADRWALLPALDEDKSTAGTRPLLAPAYVAGIIDGEGSVFLRERNPHVSVSNTSRVLMDELARFGGHRQVRDRGRSIGNLPAWGWAMRGEKAAIMLRACLPYLLIKRDKATTALAAWASVAGSNHEHFAAKARAEMLAILDGEWVA